MTVSKIDILNKKFSRCLRGYCTEEVDLAMHDAAEALGEAADENRRLQERLAGLERTLANKCPEPLRTYPPSDMRDALAAGSKIVEEIHESTRRDAQRMLEDARAEGERIVAAANLVKASIFEEIAEIRAQREAFEQEMRKLLEDHFRLLESSESSTSKSKSGGDFTFADGQE